MAREALEHLEGCPDLERVEIYEHRKPPTARAEARLVSIRRCIQCGAHEILEDGGKLARSTSKPRSGVAAIADDVPADGPEPSPAKKPSTKKATSKGRGRGSRTKEKPNGEADTDAG